MPGRFRIGGEHGADELVPFEVGPIRVWGHEDGRFEESRRSGLGRCDIAVSQPARGVKYGRQEQTGPVKVNGDLVNHATNCSVTSGAICLQSEGALIHYRNIQLKPLQ